MQTNNFKNNYNPNPSVFFPNSMNYSLCNQYPYNKYKENDERFGGFLVPFLAGAVVSAPFWYLGANNKYQQISKEKSAKNIKNNKNIDKNQANEVK